LEKEQGTKRQETLKQEVWGDILGEGFDVKRFEDTHESAWSIVESSMMKGSGVPLLFRRRRSASRKRKTYQKVY
jgi:hypothetical protein